MSNTPQIIGGTNVNILAIDPSVRHTGYAVFSDVDRIHKKPKLYRYGALKVSTKNYMPIVRNLFSIIERCSIEWIVIEKPTLFHSGKGLIAKESGRIVTLIHFVGFLHGYFMQADYNVAMIPVVQWKGQLPKEVVAKRVYSRIKTTIVDHNIVDAIGLGFYFIDLPIEDRMTLELL